jgi:hypothetical protein
MKITPSIITLRQAKRFNPWKPVIWAMAVYLIYLAGEVLKQ